MRPTVTARLDLMGWIEEKVNFRRRDHSVVSDHLESMDRIFCETR